MAIGSLWGCSVPARALEPTRSFGDYAHDLWSAHDGLTNETVTAILQTRDGYLWVGTEAGVRYRGGAFRPYGGAEGLPSNIVSSLCVDREGAVWVGSFGGGLSRIKDDAITTYRVAEELPVDSIAALAPGHYRFRVMACDNDGVWNVSPASFEFTLEPRYYQTPWFYGLCILVVGLGAWTHYRGRVRRAEAQFEAVLAERSRIARDLHDSLAQGFAAVSAQLEAVAETLDVAPHAARHHLDQARSQVRSSLQEVRRSLWSLRSQPPDPRDLPAAVTEIVRRITAGTSLDVRLAVSGSPRRLPEETASQMLRIAQEALTNVVRHADARTVEMELGYDRRLVRLRVRDDGRGFDPKLASAHCGRYGLLGMRERVEEIGGRLLVTSGPGTGTEVDVRIPATRGSVWKAPRRFAS
jgi:signal transduction histidine kinase